MHSGRMALLFASASLQSPASALGHVMLRITPPSAAPTPADRVVAFVAQVAPTNNTLAYMYNGLRGGLQGRFEILPYYAKAIAYGDVQARDMWEYELNLTPAQQHAILLSLYELQDARLPYAFTRKNCAYYLARLLAQAESADVAPRETFYLPIDLVRDLKRRGRVAQSSHREAAAAALARRIDRARPQEADFARRLVNEPNTVTTANLQALSPPSRAQVLELATEYGQIRHTPGTPDKAPRTAEAYERARDAWETAATDREWMRGDADAAALDERSPEEAHGLSRMALALGLKDATHGFVQGGFRFALHDLLETNPGYAPNTSLDLFHVEARCTASAAQLTRADVFDTVRLPPWTDLEHAAAWSAHFGYVAAVPGNVTVLDSDAVDLTGGLGLAKRLPWHTRVHGLALASLAIPVRSPDVAVAAGTRFGAITDLGPSMRLMANATVFYAVNARGTGEVRTGFELAQHWDITQRVGLRISWADGARGSAAFFNALGYL